jgi:hypothetical protein
VRRHLLLVLLVPGMLSGCGIKLAYNNLDRIIPWVADDYIEFDDRQEEYFDAELAAILYWHRTTQLPDYAAALRRFDADVSGGLTLEELLVMEEKVLAASHAFRARFVPMATEILYSTTPGQRADIKRRFDKRNAKYLKPIADLDIAEEQERWRRDFEDGFEFLLGRASAAQEARIARVAREFVPEERMWIEYRERWQKDVFTLMDLDLSYPELLVRMSGMVDYRERWYGAHYDDVMVRNERLYRDVAVDLANSLSERQQRALSKRLLGWAKAFEELALDADPEPPPLACMAGCPVYAGYSSSTNQPIR